MNWTQFHFLRPWWLLLLLVAVAAFWWQRRGRTPRSAWNQVVDAHLLPHLLSGTERASKGHQWWLPFFLVLISFSLAGPTYQQIASHSNLVGRPLVVILELSNHMLSTDISPSRLKRALYKLKDLLAEERGREVSLIAFAGDAHVVAPLTTDHRTILTLSDSLSPNIMPVPGAKLLTGLKASLSMTAGGADILVVTSSNVQEDPETLVQYIEDNNLRVIFWSFATDAGAPLVSPDGRFDATRSGAVAISGLRRDWLQKLGKSSRVNLVETSANDADLKNIHQRLGQQFHESTTGQESAFDAWHDLGPYILAIALLVFLLASAFYGPQWWLVCLLLWLPQTQAKASFFSDWFLRSDQKAHQALVQNNPEQAAQLYEDDFSKGTALFKAKKFEEATQHLAKVNTSEGRYNLGNALAHLNKIPEAVSAYTEALKLDPVHLDAKHNKEVLEKLLKEQQKQEEKPENQDQQESKPPEKKEDEKPNQGEPSNEDNQKGANESQGGDKKSEEPKSGEQEQKPEKKAEDQKSGQAQSDDKKSQAPAGQEPKKGEEKANAAAQEEALDPNTAYYFDQLEQNNNFFLKRKFLYESQKNSRGH